MNLNLRFTWLTVVLAVSTLLPTALAGQDGSAAVNPPDAATVTTTSTSTGDDPVDALRDQQSRLTDRFKQLEQKFFNLYEYELDENPDRAELLKRAYEMSQRRGIAQRFDRLVESLGESDLQQASVGQSETIEHLQALLSLLESEDQNKRLADDQKRVEAYIKEVERLLRIQKGIRGQAEGGVDGERLANSQGKAAERAQRLSDDIRANEEGLPDSEDPDSSDPDGDKPDDVDPNDDNPGENEQDPADSTPPDGSQPGESQPGESQPGESQPGESQPGESQPGESQPGESQPGESQPGESQPDESQAPPDRSQQPQTNPVRERIDEAIKRMQEAQRKLDEAEQAESVEEMERAEEELAKAKEELEEILRQLREKEIGQKLAQLESRFRKMLEREMRIHERTQQLADVDPGQRQGDFHIESGKIGSDQSRVALDADRALLLLREEGTSVAFPETVEQMRDDMVQVAEWLRASKVDDLTLELEQEIIDTLDFMIAALIEAQEDLEDNEPPPPPPPGGPTGEQGPDPLVDQIQEIKLIRELQIRINKRHDRYAKRLANPLDPIGYSDDPEMQRALDRLADRQKRIEQITWDIVLGKAEK